MTSDPSDAAPASAGANSSRTCAHHDQAPALALCTDCGADICGACHGSDGRGFALCPACRGEEPARFHAWEDPGREYSPRTFGRTLWAALRSPSTFFEDVDTGGSLWPPLIFGILTMTVGMLIGRTWKLLLVPEFGASLADMASDQGITETQARVALLVGTPLLAAASAAVHTVLLKVAIGVAGEETDWRTCARIVGYSFAAYALMILPPIAGFPLGHLLVIIWLFNLEAGALEYYFDFGRIKATLVVLAPIFLSMMCGG